jgi:hypothetical protein
MQSETANGERPVFTSFVGASAAPSHTPAVNPQITPNPCSDIPCCFAFSATLATLFLTLSMQHYQQNNTGHQHEERYKKVAVGQDDLNGTT